MATHGKARKTTERALINRRAFSRHGFNMRGVDGKTSSQGYLPWELWEQYRKAEVVYTVMSYNTPIGWVQSDGTVVIPDVSYSKTTSHHQGLCRVYL